ncbi:MAG TPA: PspC domain-containing protein [Phototrophicaceae bacterium]|nr:PspC domain-containing protein [Phototrophicaceae bacterium]
MTDSNGKRLTLSSTDKKVAGVCGGLAEFFNIDTTLVRAAFVLLALAGGPGVLIYIALWMVMPKDTSVDYDYEYEKTKRGEA